jgi:GT2 family glycosyltransferase
MKVISASSAGSEGLSISIVVYRPNAALLARTLSSLGVACEQWRASVSAEPVTLFLVDNGGLGEMHAEIAALAAHGVACRIISGHGNVGYGRGHNLAIEQAASRFHLVLNPDVDIDPQAFVAASAFFGTHADVGLLAPYIADDVHGIQYLCRRYPTLLDLFVRGFLPPSLRAVFDARLARYEMRDQLNAEEIVWDPPIISGCFMWFRTDVLKRLQGFDPRYFLYFEDYDLSLRTHDMARVAYVPSVRVVHHGGGASRKGGAHIRMFAASAYRFFNRFGWRLW